VESIDGHQKTKVKKPISHKFDKNRTVEARPLTSLAALGEGADKAVNVGGA